MDFPIFHLLFEKSISEIEKSYNFKGLPFCEFTFLENRLFYHRTSSNITEILLYSQDFHAESFEYLDDNHEGYKVFIKGFLRKISFKTQSLTIFLKNRRILALNEGKAENSLDFSLGFNKEKMAFELRKKAYSIGRARFSMEYRKSPGKAKNLVFNLNNLILLMNFGVFLSILDYMNIRKSNEEKIDENEKNEEIINKNEENVEKHKENEENEEKLNENLPNTKKTLIIEVFLRNFLACIESSNSENIFSLKSNINLRYSSNEASDFHLQFHKEKPIFSSKSLVKKSLITSKFNISFTKFELFNCSKIDIFCEKPENYDIWKLEIKKRALLQPLFLEYFTEDFMCNCFGFIKEIMKKSRLSLGNTRANLSYKDLLLMYETGVFQQESMKKMENSKKIEENFRNYRKNSSSEEEEASFERNREEIDDVSINSEEKIHQPRSTEEIGFTEEKHASFFVCSEKIEIVSFFPKKTRFF